MNRPLCLLICEIILTEGEEEEEEEEGGGEKKKEKKEKKKIQRNNRVSCLVRISFPIHRRYYEWARFTSITRSVSRSLPTHISRINKQLIREYKAVDSSILVDEIRGLCTIGYDG